MAKQRFEVDAACDSCKATGLYVGMAERDGMAVVCNSCKGTGKVRRVLEWSEFEGRKEREGIVRVIAVNPGIVVGVGSGHGLGAFGGMPYEDWAAGASFPPGSEMRQYTCPAWWYQNANTSLKPGWKECNWGRFSNCQHFPNKAACWERWDREFDSKGGEETDD